MKPRKYTPEEEEAHAVREMLLRYQHGADKYPRSPFFKRFMAKLRKCLRQSAEGEGWKGDR